MGGGRIRGSGVLGWVWVESCRVRVVVVVLDVGVRVGCGSWVVDEQEGWTAMGCVGVCGLRVSGECVGQVQVMVVVLDVGVWIGCGS